MKIATTANGGYMTFEDVPVPEGREIEHGWTSEIVTVYDKNGNEVRKFWRSASKD